ncbi:hypothetical protein N7466_003889 [Penicillium verhagenii]|uniref:uncharacterized protein n=1 Tax=Penicillium verhagenii TaxID=1562060 RepID=UPI002545664C|nr:uncharacterized protein N7466_003889 [Penicillium verhagenii]KAJ5934342.1 hypothetical protein N7466_003889 [Penicillium verhagenii]
MNQSKSMSLLKRQARSHCWLAKLISTTGRIMRFLAAMCVVKEVVPGSYTSITLIVYYSG